jgi:mono/diheme cytochrome c family protein
MKKVLRALGILLASLIILLLIAGTTIAMIGSSRIAAAPYVEHEFRAAEADSLLIARGEDLVKTKSHCHDCHGQGLGGSIMGEADEFGLFVASNLTSGAGGMGSTFTDADWERAIRHGIGGDGRVLVGMPAELLSQYSDEDLNAVLAYLKQLPPIDNELPKTQPGLLAKLLVGSGMYNPPSRVVDPDMQHAISAPADSPAAYGEYLVSISICQECHGKALKGPEFPGPPPGPDLTRTGNPGNWSESDFITTIRTGSTPDGRILDPSQMPWPNFAQMSDSDLSAIWAFLSSLD